MARTRASSHIRPTIVAALPVTTLKTPAGSPARSPSSARASAERGVSDEGCATTVQPAARAAAALRVIIAEGKFQGVTMPTTPSASRRTIISASARWLVTLSALRRLPSSAYHSMNEAAYSISPRDSASGLPCSRVIKRARSSRASSMRPCHLRRIAARACGSMLRQELNAFSAASIASDVCAASSEATKASDAPLAGSLTSRLEPSCPATQRPPT